MVSGSLRSRKSQTAHCRSLYFEKPVVNSRVVSPRNTIFELFEPRCPLPFDITLPVRGSITLIHLSLQVVAISEPSRLKLKLWIVSGWQLIEPTTWPVPVCQIRIRWSKPIENRIWSAVGCHSIIGTRRLCSASVTSESTIDVRRSQGSSGMCQTFTVQSSEHEATVKENVWFFKKSMVIVCNKMTYWCYR